MPDQAQGAGRRNSQVAQVCNSRYQDKKMELTGQSVSLRNAMYAALQYARVFGWPQGSDLPSRPSGRMVWEGDCGSLCPSTSPSGDNLESNAAER